MENQSPKILTPKIPSLFTFLGCIVFAFLIWWYLTNQRHADLREELDNFPKTLTAKISADLNVRLPALERLAHRWQERGGTPKEEFLADAADYMRDLPGFQAIEWVDKSYHVRWIVPLAGNERALNLNLGFEERRRQSLEIAKNLMHPTMSKPINLVQGGKGVLVYFPIYVKGQFEGFLLVVFRTQEWLNYVLTSEDVDEDVLDFELSVAMSGDVVFTTPNYQPNDDSEWISKHEINVLDHPISVSVQPTSHFFIHEGKFVALAVSGAFSLFGIVLGILVFALQKTSVVGRQMQDTNARLEAESHVRKMAEKEALAANEAKTKFLAAMSHEIRTPLNGVLGILQLVNEYPLQKEVSDRLKIAQDSGNYLLTLVNQVLDFARIEAGSIEGEQENFSLNSLMVDLHSMFNDQAQKKGLQFEFSTLCPNSLWVKGDYAHIKQVLFNLIGNAIKFTSKGKVTYVVRAKYGENNGIQLTFEVIDTGPGISNEEQSTIFEEFKQSESGRKSGLGTGLGLSISKQLVDYMGGHLKVESAINKGTSFSFSVAVVETEVQQVPLKATQNHIKIDPLTILVAEDNSINQLIVKEMLGNDCHQVTMVSNGAEAVEEIEKFPLRYDLILMDIQMPIMNGMEATKAIRALISDPNKLPIYALTANAFSSQVEQYREVGMQGTLTKPIVQKDLRAVLALYSQPVDQAKDGGEAELQKNNVEIVPGYLDVEILNNLVEILSDDQFENFHNSLIEATNNILDEFVTEELNADRCKSLAHELGGMAANSGLPYLSKKAQEVEEFADKGENTFVLRQRTSEVAKESLKLLSTFIEEQIINRKKISVI
ncbi:MAG: ATP-binding protein [Sneathiella sp.]